MKKARFLLLALLLTSIGKIYAQYPSDDIRLELVMYASPLVPTMSELNSKIPFGIFGEHPMLRRFEFEVWYLAYSPYLISTVFTEIGLAVKFAPVNREKMKLTLGVGTAFEFFDESFSMPLFADFEIMFRLPWHLWSGLEIDFLLWENGLGLEGYIPIRFLPEGRFYGGIEPGFVGYLANGFIMTSTKISLFVGFRF